ncbi:MAG: heavy metal-responsive transcriptional regulator [Planctomycetota bacterium]|jgi:MerR family mercuric resistance operon transcriptional regulator
MTITVGKLAKEAGINLETVRFYEREKLLPRPERTSGGHRIYTEDDIARLKFIQSAKFVGFTLKEIRTLMRVRETEPDGECEDAMDLARAKLDEIEKRIQHLHNMRESLHKFVHSCPDKGRGHCTVMNGIEKLTTE